MLSARHFNDASDKTYERLLLAEFSNYRKELETKTLHTRKGNRNLCSS